MHNDTIRDLFDQASQSCKVTPTTWRAIQQQAGTFRRPNRVRQRRVGRRTALSAVAGIVLVAGLATSGLVSPAMAQVLHRIPVIGSIWENFTIHQRQMATVTDATATDRAVAMKVTRAFYDHNRIVLYYTLTIPDGELSRPQAASQLPDGQVFPQLQFDNNFLKVGGKPLRYNSMLGDGEKRVGPNEYSGSIDVEGIMGPLPDHVDLQVTAHHIGRAEGNWTLSVPLSSAATDVKTVTYNPGVTRVSGPLQLTVKQVSIGPVTMTVDYQIQATATDAKQPYDIRGIRFGVFTNGSYLQETGGGIAETHQSGGTVTTDLSVTYVAPAEPVTSFEVRPTYAPLNPVPPRLSPVSIPVTSHLPILMDQGSYGVSKITNIDFQKTQTIVEVDLSPQSLEHLPFWFEDANGHAWKDTYQRTATGGEIFPPMSPNTSLSIHTQKATGDTGESKPIADLNTTVTLK